MGRKIKIASNVVVILAILAYMVFTVVMVKDRRGAIKFSKLEVSILDSAEVGFVTSDSIEKLVFDQIAPLGKFMDEIQLSDIERKIKANQYVDSVEVNSSIDGVVRVNLTQHRPVMRVLCENGYNFLVDTSLNILRPTIHYHPKVPIVSGNACFSFSPYFYGKLDAKKYDFDAKNLKKLINFVNFVAGDEFLDRLCAQIFVTCGAANRMQIVIVPTVGQAVIEIGEADDYEEKLLKAKAFYRSAYSYAGLDTAKIVDVKFKNQILVR